MKICEPEKCFGCFSCVNICPKMAVKMNVTDNGHIVAVTDEQKCVSCKLCQKVCPALQSPVLHEPVNVYACWNKDKKEQAKSSSGGISAMLAAQVIAEGGIVYGAGFDSEWNVNHIRCETAEDIKAIRKSKYVQSWINNIYSLAEKDLKNGKQVMFVGTPCQVAGLKSFLRKEYSKLLTVDLVCHGTPSRAVYREELEEKARLKDLKDISFRGNYGYGYGYGFGFAYDNGLESFSIRQSYYMRGFMDGLFFRESCYECPFAGKKRTGDITLGDFWGIGKKVPFENKDKNRVSLVLSNTDAGKHWLSKIKNKAFFQERTLEEAAEGNPQLQHPFAKPKGYEKFRKLYKKSSLRKSAQKIYPKMRIRLLLEKYRIVKVKR